MTWRFTLEDRMAFQKVRRLLAEMMHRGETVELLRLTRLAYDAALKAAYPTNDMAEVGVLREWIAHIGAYLDAADQTARRAAIATIAGFTDRVADILGPFPTPPPQADQVDARHWWMGH